MDKINKDIKECDFCDSKATTLCFDCIIYFCDNCYKYIHNKEKNYHHKKELIDLYLPIDIKCPAHPKIPFNLFCIDEKGKLFSIY